MKRCDDCHSTEHPTESRWSPTAEWDDDPVTLCVDRVACWTRWNRRNGYGEPDYSAGVQPVRSLIEGDVR